MAHQFLFFSTFRGIAQLVEQWSPKPRAEGSNPSAPAIYITKIPQLRQLWDFCIFTTFVIVYPDFVYKYATLPTVG